MKILIAVAAYPPSTLYGGPATVAAQHAEVLARRGHDVTVLTTDIGLSDDLRSKDKAPELPYTLVRLPALLPAGRLPLAYAPSLQGWLGKNLRGFQAVHVHFARELFPVTVAQAARRLGIPYLLQPHGMISGRGGMRDAVDLAWTQQLMRSAAGVMALQEVEEAALATLEPRAHLLRVPNGLSPAQGDQARVPNGGGQLPVILFLARLHPRKRVMDFVHMADMLTREGRSLSFRVVGPDGGDREAAEHLVAALGLQSRFTFTGGLPPMEARREMQNATVYVLPSVEEPFPMTVLEALSLGTPVVATDTLHIRELLTESRAVQIADPTMKPPQALAQAVATLLDHPQEAQAQAERGQALIATQLTLDRVAERLEEAYLHARIYSPGY